MRLLLVTMDFPPDIGGTQTYAHQLASRLSARCEDFAVITPHGDDSKHFDDALPYPVHRVRGNSDFFPVSAVRTIAKLGRTRGFEACFCVSWQGSLSALMARSLGGPQRTYTAAHGRELLFNPFEHGTLPAIAYHWLRRLSLFSSTYVYPVSRNTKGILSRLGIEEGRTHVLGNGTDPNHFCPENVSALRESLGIENRTIVLSVGRLVRRKGVDVMLDAMPQVLEQLPDALYVVIGQGPELQRLRSQSQRLGLSRSVLFLAERHPDELRQWFNLADVFVLPTRNLSMDVEGFGLVFLEAAACEKPVVGTLSGGVSDAVLDGETGLLVPSESPAALSRAVIRLLTHTDVAKRMGKAGRHRVLSFANWDQVAFTLFGSISRSLEEYRIKEDLARTRPLPFSFFRF